MALSPMMQHYLQQKEKYKDCILFYRLGDFYEMFFEDAVKASNLLDLTLTGKDCGLEERAPMCGIPFHAAEVYIAKLVQMGEKVAICEQLTEPNGRGLVERDVVKIVTAGTITNSELIDDKKNNFIVSVYLEDKKGAVSWADITTGDFLVKEFEGENFYGYILDLLVRISPAEIIANKIAIEIFNNMPIIEHGILPKFSYFTESEFNYKNANSVLLNHFKALNLDAFNLTDKKSAICSSGALISYLRQTQMHALKNICKISIENDGEFMMLDVNAIRNLELVKTLRDGKRHGTLLWLLDHTKTSMGARKLTNWILTPLNDINEINKRLNGVDALYKNTPIRFSISENLSFVKDICRISGKLSNGNITPKDCVALKNSLCVLPNLKFQLSGMQEDIINDIVNNLFDTTDIYKLLDSAFIESAPNTFKDGGFIKEGYNTELDRLVKFKNNGVNMVREMEAREREKTGIKNLKIAYNRVFGYYIEITNSFKELTPYNYVRRQTIANAERYITDELKELESDILTSAEKSVALENQLYSEILEFLTSKLDILLKISDAISTLDVLVSLATVAKENGYVKPEILPSGSDFIVKDGRHPVVEAILKQRFVPNDLELNDDCNLMIITGPNMAGKSTYMRQNALICLMAHIGSFVPATSAKIPLTDKIFTRIGASDNLILDQSTFMVEMSEMASILNNATKNSLIIIDEIGRGTSTFDGLSIAWAVAEYLNNKIGAKTLFATHYHELTELENLTKNVKNYKVTVKEYNGSIVFLRKIMRGGTNKSFGIEVAELAGINGEITDRAKKVLKSLEKKESTRINEEEPENEIETLTEVERIIKEINVNNLSPIEALNLISDLQEKVKEK